MRVVTCCAGGRQAVLPGAIVCGLAAGAVYTLDDSLHPMKAAQQWLAKNGLIDIDNSGKLPAVV